MVCLGLGDGPTRVLSLQQVLCTVVDGEGETLEAEQGPVEVPREQV